MPIVINNDPGALGYGGVSLAIGAGMRADIEDERRMRAYQFDRNLKLQTDAQKNQAQQFYDGLRARRQEGEAQRQFQRLLEGDRGKQMLDQIDARNKGYLDYAKEQTAARQAAQQGGTYRPQTIKNEVAETELKRMLDSGRFSYSPEQSKRYNQLQQAVQRVLNDPSMNKAQKAGIVPDLMRQMDDIKFNPQPKLPGQDMSLQEQFQRDTVQYNGALYQRNEQKGVWEELGSRPKPTVTESSYVKMFEAQIESLKAMYEQVDENGNISYTKDPQLIIDEARMNTSRFIARMRASLRDQPGIDGTDFMQQQQQGFGATPGMDLPTGIDTGIPQGNQNPLAEAIRTRALKDQVGGTLPKSNPLWGDKKRGTRHSLQAYEEFPAADNEMAKPDEAKQFKTLPTDGNGMPLYEEMKRGQRYVHVDKVTGKTYYLEIDDKGEVHILDTKRKK